MSPMRNARLCRRVDQWQSLADWHIQGARAQQFFLPVPIPWYVSLEDVSWYRLVQVSTVCTDRSDATAQPGATSAFAALPTA